jgi:hypothetical protein
MNARDACIRSVFPLRLFRINRAITSTIVRAIDDRMRGNPLPTRTDRRPRPRSVETKPPPDAYKKTPRLAPPRPPVSPSQSMSAARWPARVPPLCPCVYPPPCVYPGYTHTPSTPPLDGPGPVDRDTSTAHARGKERVPPPPHKKQTKKKRAPPPFTNAKINTHGGGRRRIQPTRGSVRSPRAPACAMDNDRCHVSGPCGSCVPSTRIGHDSRKNDTPTTDRAYASASSSSSSPFPLVRSTSRVVSARRTCAFDSLDASTAVDRHPSHLDPRRLRASASTSRARETRTKTPRVDRPNAATATTDDDDRR